MCTGIGMNMFQFLHVYQMFKSKSSIGQSEYAIIGYLVCFIVWFLYGCKKNDNVIKFSNVTAIISSLILLITIYYYR